MGGRSRKLAAAQQVGTLVTPCAQIGIVMHLKSNPADRGELPRGQKAECDEEFVMVTRVLVVEDEIFVATEIEHVIEEMGLTSVGIAHDERSAMALAAQADVALVDLNLQDGPSGIRIGATLAQAHGATVLFLTANPSQLGNGVTGALGVLAKPVSDGDLREALTYALGRRAGIEVAPPARLRLFEEATALSATG